MKLLRRLSSNKSTIHNSSLIVKRVGAALMVGLLAISVPVREAAAAALECGGAITRVNVADCALRASMTARAEEHTLRSIEGRRTAASLLLPSNPTLNLVGGYPIEPSLNDRFLVWSATLSQELEIAGQRGARLDVTAAEREIQKQRVAAIRVEIASQALAAYFDALSAVEEARLAATLAALGDALQTVARTRAQIGIGSDVEARLADGAAIRIAQSRIAAEQRVASTRATLATLLGLDPASNLHLEGELAPLAIIEQSPARIVEKAVARRAEIGIARAERELQERRRALYEKQRVPNPTISIFARNDWIGERAIGLGVGIPIPLPAPVGRTYAGEIAESAALADRAAAQLEAVRRSIRLEVDTALAAVSARRRERELYTPERIRETEAALSAVAEEIASRRLPVREAILTQQGLIEVLSGSIRAKRELCLASVELARAAGMVQEERAP